jgi:Transposase zinc-binding domain
MRSQRVAASRPMTGGVTRGCAGCCTSPPRCQMRPRSGVLRRGVAARHGSRWAPRRGSLRPARRRRHGPARGHPGAPGDLLAAAAARTDGVGLPRFIERELRGFLRCGLLVHGFLRVRCEDCAFERLVPLSCKGRAVCASCGGRRMAEQAANLVQASVYISSPSPRLLLALAGPTCDGSTWRPSRRLRRRRRC